MADRAESREGVLHQLRSDMTAFRCHWWETPSAALILNLANTGDLAVAVAGLIDVLREGWDPDWVAGGSGAPAAFGVADEWLAAGIDAREVAGWLRAGCWSPEAARRMIGYGLRPVRLLDAQGVPVHLVDRGPDGEIPLAQAVADNFLTAEMALRIVAGRPNSSPGGGWPERDPASRSGPSNG